ncbi:MAG TPA: NAD-dependent epimerase/dehydratase family protein [Phnomibacter sp.]|nr:NAD-dependent epimerase/dehydratase family protein [Phnomibacter sp.]
MKNVLLTGASGYLGGYIQAALEQNGYRVISVGRANSNQVVCNLATTVPTITDKIDWVVHAMGKAHMLPTTEQEARGFFEVNVQGTKNICAALEQQASIPERFIFISSIAVYGVDEGEQIDEQAALKGSSPYAKSKIEAEQFLEKWCSEHKVDLLVFRLPLVAGAKPPGNLGGMIQGIRNGRYYNIDEGKAKKSVVLAADVAEAILSTSGIKGTYNLTDGYHPSFAELARIISQQLGKSEPYNIPSWVALPAALAGNFLGSRAPLNYHKLRKITATLTFSDQLARKNFGWQPRKVLEHFKIE